MKRLPLLIILFMFLQQSNAQRLVKKGDEALQVLHYYEAISNYESQLNKRRNSNETIAEVNYKIGYCYLKLSLPEIARSYFEKAIEYNFSNPLLHYYYGKTLQMNQQYYDALMEYEKFKELDRGNELALTAIESINYSFEMLREPTRYEVNIVARLSSPESDYSPFFEQRNYRKVYFTSTRFTETGIGANPESGDFPSNIFVAEIDRNGNWTDPVILPGNVNTSEEEGAASLNFRSSNLYFTRCTYHKKRDKGCRIFLARKSGSMWGRVVEINILGIPDHVSIGHPAISDDELTLYFAAEGLPVNYGGKDIYVVHREKRNQDFGVPMNLGPIINTSGDEMYPHIRRNGDLYFSSNGHPGMGGLDIFKAIKTDNSFDVINLGSPINSSHDDFGIVFMGNREEGFLSSRRLRGMGKTDLFHFVLPEMRLSLSGTVQDDMTLEKIENVEIQIMNDEMLLIETHYTDKNGAYKIFLEPEMHYIINYISEHYKAESINIDTRNIEDSKDFRRDVFLNQ